MVKQEDVIITIGEESFTVPGAVVTAIAEATGYKEQVLQSNEETGEKTLVPNPRTRASYVFEAIKNQLLGQIRRHKKRAEQEKAQQATQQYMERLSF